VLALLLLAVVLGMLGVVRIPGFAAGERGVVAPALARPPRAVSPSFSLTLGSYREAAVARLQAEALGRERPDLLFVVAPVEVDGEVFYRLLAGPSTDSLAGGLRAELARTLTAEDPAGWVVRATPLAFHLGVQATLEEAGARTAELLAREVPAYVLADGEGEALRFHVWAGAFADPREAAWLQGILEREGIPAPLQRRRGRLPG
jgi:hypothetical protein